VTGIFSAGAAALGRAMASALDIEGVCVANIGPYTMEQAIQNIELARRYKPLTATEREELLACDYDVRTIHCRRQMHV
jgi:hypothetical protein